MNEYQILYYVFLFVVNLAIFVSLTAFMVYKGWIPPVSQSQPDQDHINQPNSGTTLIENIP